MVDITSLVEVSAHSETMVHSRISFSEVLETVSAGASRNEMVHHFSCPAYTLDAKIAIGPVWAEVPPARGRKKWHAHT